MLKFPRSPTCSLSTITVCESDRSLQNKVRGEKTDWDKAELVVTLWLKSANDGATSEACRYSHPSQRDEGVVARLRLLGSYSKWCTLPDIFLLAGVCANVSTRNDSDIFQETTDRCDGTLQFYFEQSRKPKGLLGLRITHKGVVELAARRRGLKKILGMKTGGGGYETRCCAIKLRRPSAAECK